MEEEEELKCAKTAKKLTQSQMLDNIVKGKPPRSQPEVKGKTKIAIQNEKLNNSFHETFFG